MQSLELPTSMNLFENRHSYGHLNRSSHSSLFCKHDTLFLHSFMCLFLTACANRKEPLEKAWRFSFLPQNHSISLLFWSRTFGSLAGPFFANIEASF